MGGDSVSIVRDSGGTNQSASYAWIIGIIALVGILFAVIFFARK